MGRSDGKDARFLKRARTGRERLGCLEHGHRNENRMTRDEIDREMGSLMGKLVADAMSAEEKVRLQDLSWMLSKSMTRELLPRRRVVSRTRRGLWNSE